MSYDNTGYLGVLRYLIPMPYHFDFLIPSNATINFEGDSMPHLHQNILCIFL